MKLYRRIVITLAIVVVILFAVDSSKATYCTLCDLLGDANNDNITDKQDATLIAKYLINAESVPTISSCADINQDSLVRVNDIMWIVNGKIASVKLSETSAMLAVGESIELVATINPSTARNKEIKWTSSNTSVATVNSSGKVTAVADGETTITATSKVDSTKKATATITVDSTSISISEPANVDKYYINGKYTLTAVVTPSTTETIEWTSSKPSVASISKGILTTKTAGTTKITAKINNKTASVTLTINEPYVKEDAFPYEYKDGSGELKIERKEYTSQLTTRTTIYYLAHLKITDYTRLHSAINNNGSSSYSSCGKQVYKVDKTTGETTLVGQNCGYVSVAAENENAIFAVEGDYSLNGGHKCNGITGSIRDGEYYFTEGHQKDLTTLSASKLGYGFYSKKTGIMGPTSSLTSENAALAVSSREATDTFCFSTDLVVDGTFADNSYINETAHRQANFIGYKGKGEYYFVVSEGAAYSDADIPSDGQSYGLIPKDRAQILIDLGCSYGVQLDGGQSVIVWFRGQKLQSRVEIPSERDWLTDHVYFK